VPPGDRDKDWATVLQYVVDVVGAVGGAAAIVDSVLGWRDRIAKRDAAPRATGYAGGHAEPLITATRDELTDLVEADPSLVKPRPANPTDRTDRTI
jgi:hypothetical protein